MHFKRNSWLYSNIRQIFKWTGTELFSMEGLSYSVCNHLSFSCNKTIRTQAIRVSISAEDFLDHDLKTFKPNCPVFLLSLRCVSNVTCHDTLTIFCMPLYFYLNISCACIIFGPATFVMAVRMPCMYNTTHVHEMI